ncbi:MAG: exodeoxyribonuclease VII small subunit [Lachnospiraceae bacterium]|nr:exodeoxyribonuclease VII small subunit [Lachnospiraceae bacterium]
MSQTKEKVTDPYGELSIEEGFKQLDEIITKMSDEDVPIETAFADFEKGIALLKSTNSKIDRVEKSVKAINEEGGLDEFKRPD